MKLNSADVVQVTQQREQAPAQLVIPHFYFVVITSRNNERLAAMKIDTTYRPVVFLKLIEHSAHSVVPQLDMAIVQGCQNPRANGMKTEAFHAIAFAFKLGQHLVHFR